MLYSSLVWPYSLHDQALLLLEVWLHYMVITMCDCNRGWLFTMQAAWMHSHQIQETIACPLPPFFPWLSLIYVFGFLNDTYLFCFGVKCGLLIVMEAHKWRTFDNKHWGDWVRKCYCRMEEQTRCGTQL